MKKFLVFLCFLFLPSIVFASQVGFVPANGIWFSRTDVKPGETIRVYTVVVNSNFYALNGVVEFYDNDKIIDTADVKLLKKDEARQIRIFWEPEEGEHHVSARLTKAESVDANGIVKPLSSEVIASVTGLPLFLKADTSQIIGETKLLIEKKEDILVLTPVQVSEEKITSKTTSSTGQKLTLTLEEVTQKKEEFTRQAEAFTSTITSTTGRIAGFYTTAKSWAESGSGWYQKTKDYVQKAQPVLRNMYVGWLRVTNNNEPKIIVLIILATFVLWFIVRRLLRRKRFYDELA